MKTLFSILTLWMLSNSPAWGVEPVWDVTDGTYKSLNQFRSDQAQRGAQQQLENRVWQLERELKAREQSENLGLDNWKCDYCGVLDATD